MIDMLVKPIPYEEESPGSFMLRACEYNGWDNLVKFIHAHDCKRLNSAVETIMKIEKRWKRFCNSLGLTSEITTSMYYQDIGLTKNQFLDFEGIKLRWKDLSIKNPKICPKCIEEKNYLPRLWDFKLVYMCSKHNIELIDKCFKCKKDLMWKRRSLGICQCGYKFKVEDSNKINATPVKLIEDLIHRKESKSLNIICLFYDSLELFFEMLKIEKSKVTLTRMSILAFNNDQDITENIRHIVNTNIDKHSIHPRLSLMPFLSSKEVRIVDFAKHILTMIDYEFLGSKNNFKFKDQIISLNQASVALGINGHLAKILIRNGLLDADRQTRYRSYNVDFLSVNELLNDFSIKIKYVNPNLNYKPLIKTSFKSNVASKIDDCISNKIKYTQMNIEDGLSSVSVEPKPIVNKQNQYYSILDVAKLCDVNYENIRFSIKVGLLKRVDPKKSPGTAIYIKKIDAIKFNKKYTFGGGIAKRYNQNPTNFSEKIKSTGIQPISGPKIDGGLTYLFKRADLIHLDFDSIKNVHGYPTKVGRKKSVDKNVNTDLVTYSVAGKMLQISTSEIIHLVKKGFLFRIFKENNKARITKESIMIILNIRKNKSLIEINLAAKKVKQTVNVFYWTWVESGFIKSQNTGLEKFISIKSLNKVIRFKSKYISSVEAGELAGHHRSYFPNLEKQGKIKHKKIFKNRKYSIKFYNRKEVEKNIK